MRGVKNSTHTDGSDKRILPPRIFNRRFLRSEWKEDTGTYFHRDAIVSSTRNATVRISHVAPSMKISLVSTFSRRSLLRTTPSPYTMKFSSLAVAAVLLASSANGFTTSPIKSFGVQVRQCFSFMRRCLVRKVM